MLVTPTRHECHGRGWMMAWPQQEEMWGEGTHPTSALVTEEFSVCSGNLKQHSGYLNYLNDKRHYIFRNKRKKKTKRKRKL